MSKDYESMVQTSETMIDLATVRLMLDRLTAPRQSSVSFGVKGRVTICQMDVDHRDRLAAILGVHVGHHGFIKSIGNACPSEKEARPEPHFVIKPPMDSF